GPGAEVAVALGQAEAGRVQDRMAALASVDPAVPPLGEVDVDPVAGQLGHATTADATRAIATPASTTTTARRAGRSHARRRASTSRSCAGARTRAVVARGS